MNVDIPVNDEEPRMVLFRKK